MHERVAKREHPGKPEVGDVPAATGDESRVLATTHGRAEEPTGRQPGGAFAHWALTTGIR